MTRSREALDLEIRQLFSEVCAAHSDLDAPPSLEESSVLLQTGLDSLGYAILVTRLEETLGYDPFSRSPEPYYPTTYGEFLDFYLANQDE